MLQWYNLRFSSFASIHVGSVGNAKVHMVSVFCALSNLCQNTDSGVEVSYGLIIALFHILGSVP